MNGIRGIGEMHGVKALMGRIDEPNIPGHLSPPQFNFLYQLVLDRKPQTAVEIGTYMGRSSYAISKAIRDTNNGGRLICVDSWEQALTDEYFSSDHITSLFRMFPTVRTLYVRPGEFESMREMFEVTRERYPFMKQIIEVRHTRSANVDFRDTRIDFSFIDGDHTYAGIKRDIEKILEGASSGTVMAFHDYSEAHYPGVVKAISELRESRATEWLGLVEFTAAIRLL